MNSSQFDNTQKLCIIFPNEKSLKRKVDKTYIYSTELNKEVKGKK